MEFVIAALSFALNQIAEPLGARLAMNALP
jgi:hypothetical protein